VSFVDIESSTGRIKGFLDKIHKILWAKTYRPTVVPHGWIPKPDGGKRLLN
jgi:retron-type reverse transcriptase